MSAKRPYVPEGEGDPGKTPSGAAGAGKGRPEERGTQGGRGLRRPFVAGTARPPSSSEMAEDGAEAEPATEPEYIDFDFDALLAPGEVPAVLRDEPSAHGPAARPGPARPASEESHLYGIGEELVRLRRQVELRKAEAEILTQLQSEADSPATRDLIEAAFAAGYFAGKGELERRIGHAR